MPASQAFKDAIDAAIRASDTTISYGNEVEGVNEPLISVQLASIPILQQDLAQAQAERDQALVLASQRRTAIDGALQDLQAAP